MITTRINALFLVAISFSFSNPLTNNLNNRLREDNTKCAQKTSTNYGFDVNAAEPETFKIVSTSSNSTNTSHSLSLKFSSSTSYLYANKDPYRGVFISSDDPQCKNDLGISDPSLKTKYDFDPNNPDLSLVALDDSGEPILNEDGTYQFIPDKDGITHDYKINIPVFEGTVYRIEPSSSTIVIPYVINRSDRYKIKVTSISSNVFNFTTKSNGSTSDYAASVSNIIIGPNITRVASDAFKVVDSKIDQISLNFIGQQNLIQFDHDWTNISSINFNYSIDSSSLSNKQKNDAIANFNLGDLLDDSSKPLYYDELGYLVDFEGNYVDKSKGVASGTLTKIEAASDIAFNLKGDKSSEKSFALGSSADNRPMVLQYDVETLSGEKETRYYEFPYDPDNRGVGDLPGKKEIRLDCDFHVDPSEKVVEDSFVVRNIFESEASEFKPDLSKEYKYVPSKGYSTSFAFEDFVSRKNSKIRTFGGYTSFTITLDKVFGIYERVNPVSFNAYKDKIEDGKMKIRYSFTGLNKSSYRITFVKNGELVTKEISFNDSSKNGITLDFHLLTANKNNEVTFLIKNSLVDKDFSANSVRRVEYKGLSFKLDLMNTKKGTTQVVTKSAVVSRFGYFDILPNQNESSYFNSITFIVVASLIYMFVYIAATLVYYFYAKEAFKNDEFKRMNPKKYFRNMSTYLVGSLVVVLGLLFTITRFAFFNTSVVVYNPVDPFVIIIDFVSIVIIGFFIKNALISIKAKKARKEALRLKLNDDVTEDGTK